MKHSEHITDLEGELERLERRTTTHRQDAHSDDQTGFYDCALCGILDVRERRLWRRLAALLQQRDNPLGYSDDDSGY